VEQQGDAIERLGATNSHSKEQIQTVEPNQSPFPTKKQRDDEAKSTIIPESDLVEDTKRTIIPKSETKFQNTQILLDQNFSTDMFIISRGDATSRSGLSN
jgi:hypothetical protein